MDLALPPDLTDPPGGDMVNKEYSGGGVNQGD